MMFGSGPIEEPTTALASHEIIPDLRIVPLSALVPHEEHDTQIWNNFM